MSKRDNLKTNRRRLRRALNRALGAVASVRGGIHNTRYGGGVSQKTFGRADNEAN